ncbi:hypothetical protein D3C72_1316890 [compost metagenome]
MIHGLGAVEGADRALARPITPQFETDRAAGRRVVGRVAGNLPVQVQHPAEVGDIGVVSGQNRQGRPAFQRGQHPARQRRGRSGGDIGRAALVVEFQRVEAEEGLDVVAADPAPADLIHRLALQIFQQEGLGHGRGQTQGRTHIGEIFIVAGQGLRPLRQVAAGGQGLFGADLDRAAAQDGAEPFQQRRLSRHLRIQTADRGQRGLRRQRQIGVDGDRAGVQRMKLGVVGGRGRELHLQRAAGRQSFG